jgi:hypothetical protein
MAYIYTNDSFLSLGTKSTKCLQHGFTQIVNGQYDLRRVQEYVATNIVAELHPKTPNP